VPDERFQPLALFWVQGSTARYLGTLTELATVGNWSAPRTSTVDVADVSTTMSSHVRWDAATRLIGPFMSQIFGGSITALEASLKSGGKGIDTVRIMISRARRTFVNPLALARGIGEQTHRLPASVDPDLGKPNGPALYVIDGILTSRELILEIGGDTANETAARFETDLAGKISADHLLRTNSRLTITGNIRTPFAFTCLGTTVSPDGYIDGLGITSSTPQILNAVPISLAPQVVHPLLGGNDELLAFDN
jgi:hypothetical protein